MSLFKKMFEPDEMKKILKFGVTGVANTLVDYLIFALLSIRLGWSTELSQACAFVGGMLNSYLINRSWTFRSKQQFFSPQLVRFVVANLAVLLISVLLISLLTTGWGLYPMVAKLFVTAVTMVLNFIISRLWVFH